MKNDFMEIMKDKTDIDNEIRSAFERSTRKCARHLVLSMEGAIRQRKIERNEAIEFVNSVFKYEYARFESMDDEELFIEMLNDLSAALQKKAIKEAFSDDE